MSQEVGFEVEVSCAESKIGVTLFVFDVDEDIEAGDNVACYFLVFRGEDVAKLDRDEVARQFCQAHEEAMDSVNIHGPLTSEDFTRLLEDSIELAGELMIRHGLQNLKTDEVSEADMATLFFVDEVEDVEPKDPKLLN